MQLTSEFAGGETYERFVLLHVSSFEFSLANFKFGCNCNHDSKFFSDVMVRLASPLQRLKMRDFDPSLKVVANN